MLDEEALAQVFKWHHPSIHAVIHFAGLKAVGESVECPLKYYHNNLMGTINLLRVMDQFGVGKIVFSSSATVYGNVKEIPISENASTIPLSPYGNSKLFIEMIMKDWSRAMEGKGGKLENDGNKGETCKRAIVLRYFNPVGAHASGLIGEAPNNSHPNNLMPYLARVANGQLPLLQVFGADYDTPDGTGIRDYIHVVDLAKGHLHALKCFFRNENEDYEERKLEGNWNYEKESHDRDNGHINSHDHPDNDYEHGNSYNNNHDHDSHCFQVFNLGTGRGHSVLEMIKAFEEATERPIPFKIVKRRAGDVDRLVAQVDKAREALEWEAELSITDMCRDLWKWQSLNPNGYE